MRAHGHTIIWGTDRGIGWARDAKSWYAILKASWAFRKTVRRAVKLAAVAARWDARREALNPTRTDAAYEMAMTQGAVSMAAQPYSFIQN